VAAYPSLFLLTDGCKYRPLIIMHVVLCLIAPLRCNNLLVVHDGDAAMCHQRPDGDSGVKAGMAVRLPRCFPTAALTTWSNSSSVTCEQH
jgi:hypothetical protein